MNAHSPKNTAGWCWLSELSVSCCVTAQSVTGRGGGQWLTSSDSPAMHDLMTIYWLVQGVLKTLNTGDIKQIFCCDLDSGVRVK